MHQMALAVFGDQNLSISAKWGCHNVKVERLRRNVITQIAETCQRNKEAKFVKSAAVGVFSIVPLCLDSVAPSPAAPAPAAPSTVGCALGGLLLGGLLLGGALLGSV